VDGGGALIASGNPATIEVSGNSTFTGNKAAQTGGAIWNQTLGGLTVEAGTRFSENLAPVGYTIASGDLTQYTEKISATAFSWGYTYGCNNHDISYAAAATGAGAVTSQNVTLTYDNGLSGTDNRTSVRTLGLPASGVTVTLAAIGDLGWSRAGHTFGGWETAGTTYVAGAAFTVLEDTTLTAKWALIPIVTEEPSPSPTEEPTEEPTDEPTDEPTGEPTDEPGAETSSEEPTETPTETPTQRPGIIVRPGVPNVPPPPANQRAVLVPNDNGGGFIEFDEDGVPLGEWHFDEEIESWIFDPIVPLAVFPVPATGDVGAVIPVALFALLAAAAAIVTTRKKRVK
jgi:uncharacterized repeat protein (TIGR02543 family)